MKLNSIFYNMVAVYFISSCSSPLNVSTDFDDTVNFSTLKVYRWHTDNEYNQASKKYLANDIVDQRIRVNVDKQLSMKGFSKNNKDPIDFLVNYSVIVEEKTDISAYNNYNGYVPGFSYGLGYGSFGSQVSMRYSTAPSTRVTQYQQGTLVIDILDPETDKLIWRGMGDRRLPRNQTQQEINDLVEEAVRKTLENFPPKTQ